MKKKLLEGNPHCWLVGSAHSTTLPSRILQQLDQYLPIPSANGCQVQKFYRALVGTNLYYSSQYGRVKKRNSYTVLYAVQGNRPEIGQIQYFVCVHGCAFAVMRVFNVISTCTALFQIPHAALDYSTILPVEYQPHEKLVNISFLHRKCVFM